MSNKYSEEKLIEELQRVDEEISHGEILSMSKFDEKSQISSSTVRKRLGNESWVKSLREADIDVQYSQVQCSHNGGCSDIKLKMELIKDFHVAFPFLSFDEPLPTKGEITEKTGHSFGTYMNYFDSPQKLAEATGHEYIKSAYTRHPDEEDLIDEMVRLYRELGHFPTKNEMNEEGYFSPFAYRKHFGSYGDALKAVGCDIDSRSRRDVESDYTPTVLFGDDWNKQKELSKRRDKFECRVCKRSEGKRDVHVHHIRPRKEFLKGEYDEDKMNSLQNLICLCRYCHGRLEGKWKDSSPDEFARRGKELLGYAESEEERSLFAY